MKKYKVRMNCACYEDIVVNASNKEEAIEEAAKLAQCSANEMEFGEFLDVEDGEDAEN